jgi:CRP/FNR family transcriptional regulator, cyclic AMP receptor protein
VESVLRTLPLFARLDDEAWQDLAGHLTPAALSRGQVLFHEGDPGDAMYVVLGGKVKISRTAPDGRENLLAVLGPGDLLGELAVFDGTARTATASALVDTELVRLAYGDFQTYLATRPAVAVELLRVLAERLRQTNDAMADLVFTDVPGRVAKALLSLAARFGVAEGDLVRVSHDLTQEELAQLVGASRETVNKSLSDFANRSWIRVDGKSVVLLDRERLERRSR